MYYILLLVWLVQDSTSGDPSTRRGQSIWKTLDGKPPILLAHRGEKVLLPEHTLPGYQLAAILGADYVEPDLCMTRDEVLVCHHDIFLNQDYSDVGEHPEFLHLRRNTSEGFKWFIQDFTLNELKTLRLKQKKAGVRPQAFNGLFSIPTFQEFLHVIHEINYKMNKSVGIAPELKDPKTFNAFRSPHFFEQKFLQALKENGYPITERDVPSCHHGDIKIPCPPILIQSFEFPAIHYLSKVTNIDRVMLVYDDPALLSRKGIESIAQVAQYYSLWKESLFAGMEKFLRLTKSYDESKVKANGGLPDPHELPDLLHAKGLKLVIYTIYDSREPSYLLGNDTVSHSKRAEMQRYFELGVDGLFVENTAESRTILLEAASEMRTARLMTSGVNNSIHSHAFHLPVQCLALLLIAQQFAICTRYFA